MSVYDNLDRAAQRAYDAGVAAELGRISDGLDLIAERYKDAGVFARCVVNDVRALLTPERGDGAA